MVGEDEGDGQVMPLVHIPSPSAGRVIWHFATMAIRENPSPLCLWRCRLHADSRAERDVRVFGRFNGTEQDGHGEIRMIVSLDGYLLLISLLPAQLFCQKIHKYPDFRADGIVAVIDGMERLGHVQGTSG